MVIFSLNVVLNRDLQAIGVACLNPSYARSINRANNVRRFIIRDLQNLLVPPEDFIVKFHDTKLALRDCSDNRNPN